MFKIVVSAWLSIVWLVSYGQTNGIELVSVALDGTAGNGYSVRPSIDDAGRVVGFLSAASDLVKGDDNSRPDAFVRRRVPGTTTMLRDLVGNEFSYCLSPFMSPDGESVIFEGEQAKRRNRWLNYGNLWRFSFATANLACVTTPVTRRNASGRSTIPVSSFDNRFIAFASDSAGFGFPDGNYLWDIYLRDTHTGRYEWISRPFAYSYQYGSPEGSLWPRISGNGRFVVFQSDLDYLVPDDRNGGEDVFLHDRSTATTTLISRLPGSRFAAGGSRRASISADGRFIAFESSRAFTLEKGTQYAYNIYLYDRLSGTFRRLTNRSAGKGGGDNPTALDPKISADGSTVVFASYEQFVPEDGNETWDVYTIDVASGYTRRISIAAGGGDPNGPSYTPVISADGKSVAFSSSASNLTNNDDNRTWDVFLFRR